MRTTKIGHANEAETNRTAAIDNDVVADLNRAVGRSVHRAGHGLEESRLLVRHAVWETEHVHCDDWGRNELVLGVRPVFELVLDQVLTH